MIALDKSDRRNNAVAAISIGVTRRPSGITERSIQMIVTDLEAAGSVARERVGRRNSYTINRAQPFRHPAESDHSIGELIDLFAEGPETGGT